MGKMTWPRPRYVVVPTEHLDADRAARARGSIPMVQGYYTLQEAAQALGMPTDELKQMAQKNQIRSFQDRGTLRFRIQDVQELARRRGATSDPELRLGEAAAPPAPKSPAPKSAGPKSPAPKSPAPASPRPPAGDAPDVFEFEFDAEGAGLGSGMFGATGSGAKPAAAPKSSGGKKKPPEGSDSDVRLVADGSDVTFSLAPDSAGKPATSDSDVSVPKSPRPSKLGGASSASVRPSKLGGGSGAAGQRPSKLGSGSGAAGQRPSKLGGPASPSQPADSGVRLVPMDSDSDVRIVSSPGDEVDLGGAAPPSAGDSNVRLERVQGTPHGSGEGMLTEEINLDEELRKQEEQLKGQKPSRLKPKSEMRPPTAAPSPFELSEQDLEMPSELQQPPAAAAPPDDSSDFDLAAGGPPAEGSSDFDLAAGSSSGDFDLAAAAAGSPVEDAGEDFSLELPEAGQGDFELSSSAAPLTGPTSGISLSKPVDAGISLEGGGSEDSVDFDLSLEVEATPRPIESQEAASDSSDFDLTLDSGEAPVAEANVPDGSSSFDLDIGAAGATADSDSEFELTLDDSGNLPGMGDVPQVKAADDLEADFEVAGLDEAGSEGGGDSTDLESSDFDLALDDSDLGADGGESASEVVALDEEVAEVEASDDEVAEVAELEEETAETAGFGDLDESGEIVEDDDQRAPVKGAVREVVKEVEVPAKPAPWGVMPVIFMLPCVVVMILVGLLGFELIQSAGGYKPAGMLTKAIGSMVFDKGKLR